MLRGVVTALLAAAREGEEEVCVIRFRKSDAKWFLCRYELEPPPPWLALQVSCIQNVIMILILMTGDRPLLVFTEWLAALAAEKQGEVMYCFRILTPDHDLQLHFFLIVGSSFIFFRNKDMLCKFLVHHWSSHCSCNFLWCLFRNILHPDTSGEGDSAKQKKINHCDQQTWCLKHVGCCSATCDGRGRRF